LSPMNEGRPYFDDIVKLEKYNAERKRVSALLNGQLDRLFNEINIDKTGDTMDIVLDNKGKPKKKGFVVSDVDNTLLEMLPKHLKDIMLENNDKVTSFYVAVTKTNGQFSLEVTGNTFNNIEKPQSVELRTKIKSPRRDMRPVFQEALIRCYSNPYPNTPFLIVEKRGGSTLQDYKVTGTPEEILRQQKNDSMELIELAETLGNIKGVINSPEEEEKQTS
jgi:hypothetical protein